MIVGGTIPNVMEGQIHLLNEPAKLEELTVNENGVYLPSENYDGFSKVTVEIPDPPLDEITITENGVYTPPSNIYGFNKVSVNIPQPTIEIEQRMFVYDGVNWFRIGVTPNSNYNYEFCFINTSPNSQFNVFIGNDGDGVYEFSFCGTDENSWGYGVGNYFYWNGGTITFGEHIVKFDDHISIDGRNITNYSPATRSCNITIGYGSNYRVAKDGYFKYVKIYDRTTGNLVKHILPVRIKFDNVVYFEGIYDIINNSVVHQCTTIPISN